MTNSINTATAINGTFSTLFIKMILAGNDLAADNTEENKAASEAASRAFSAHHLAGLEDGTYNHVMVGNWMHSLLNNLNK